MIYLDNASTTKIDPEVLDEMMPYLTNEYGNAGTIYSLGINARKAVDRAREQVAAFIGAQSPEQIIFTSGGTESNNTVFHNYGLHGIRNNKRTAIVSSIEHDSVLNSARFLKKEYGFDVDIIGVDPTGKISIADLRRHISIDTALVSLMYMNNEIGSINDVRSVGKMCNEWGIPFHCDCVQAAGCMDIDVGKIRCDYISISSHKIHGPKGIGMLYVKDKSSFYQMINGGVAQEFGLRGGTEAVPLIVGFGKACELLTNNACGNYTTNLKRKFWDELTSSMKNARLLNILRSNGSSAEDYGKTLNIRFEDVDAEALVLLLSSKGVCVSAGSACSSHQQNPSHVLLGIGLDETEARESIRVSFSKMNTEQEIVEAARIIAESACALYNIGRE